MTPCPDCEGEATRTTGKPCGYSCDWCGGCQDEEDCPTCEGTGQGEEDEC